MRISEKADRQGREADGSTPVRRKAERGRSGEANSVTPTNKKLAEMRAFFGIGVRMRISEKADRQGREADGSTPVRR